MIYTLIGLIMTLGVIALILALPVWLVEYLRVPKQAGDKQINGRIVSSEGTTTLSTPIGNSPPRGADFAQFILFRVWRPGTVTVEYLYEGQTRRLDIRGSHLFQLKDGETVNLYIEKDAKGDDEIVPWLSDRYYKMSKFLAVNGCGLIGLSFVLMMLTDLAKAIF